MNTNQFEYKGQTFHTGDYVTCVIGLGLAIDHAQLYIVHSEKFYICQNVKAGSSSPNKLGYDHSWRSGIYDGRLCFDVRELRLKEPYCSKPKDPQ